MVAGHIISDQTIIVVLFPRTNASLSDTRAIAVTCLVYGIEIVHEHFAFTADKTMIFIGPDTLVTAAGST